MVAVANAFMERIILSLLPFFRAATPDPDEARAAVVGALASYGARTQHDLTETAQILALGFSTVDSLSDSTDNGMPVEIRLRLRGNAIALVRSKKTCQQALSDGRYIPVGQYAVDTEYQPVGECADGAEANEPDHAIADAEPATPNSIFERARERGRAAEGPVTDAAPDPEAASSDVTAPAATEAVLPVSHQAALRQMDVQETGEQKKTAIPSAAVISQAGGSRGLAGTHASG
jgi:hypothetical protein